MECKKAKELVVKAGTELVASGLIARTWGNVSCRIDEETFAVTPSGRNYLTLTADDIVEVKIKDLSWEGSVKPSSEKGIHAEVYRRFPEMNFVIHTHQENASAVSAAGLDEVPLPENGSEYSKAVFSEKVLCARYALPGTKTLRRNVAAALEKSGSNAVILKHHGALCYGKDYDGAMKTACDLESICGAFIMEKGGAIPVTQEKEEVSRAASRLQPGKQAAFEKKGGCVLVNRDPEVLRQARLTKPLLPYLDDFAQIVGVKAVTVKNEEQLILKALRHSAAVLVKDLGALCWGKDEKDAGAVSAILRKNCKAYFTAVLFENPRPINVLECALMRFVYLKKYSRLSEK